ncbi:PorV/PorQ family protein [bacterium]|nr:PorV/PorQ family protein [bacterium]
MRMKATVLLIIFLAVLTAAETVTAQAGVGFPFLKIDTGARQSGMGGVFTGVGDDVNAIAWNPGSIGHIRRWQWSATYNRWFSDIYQGYFTYAKQFRVLGSTKTSFAGAVNYLGMPAWDATGGIKESVSASHLVVSATAGQRLDWISDLLSLGVTLKGIYSNFDELSSRGYAADLGLMLRAPRFRIQEDGPFSFGVLSFGLSCLNLGRAVTVDAESSELPRTLRAGMALQMGSYDLVSVLLAADAVAVRHRDLAVAVGGEFWWRDMLGLRLGYRFNGADMGNLTFGVGLRWNDAFNQLLGLPTRYYDALEIDVADVGYGDVLQQTYRGTVTHYPLAPEPFHFHDPQVATSQVLGGSSKVELTWEQAFDPDPFDEVRYVIIIGRNRAQISRAIRFLERDMRGFLSSSLRDSLHTCEQVPENRFTTSVQERGVYYWAVAAYDLGYHARQSRRGDVGEIGEFVVETADILVRAVAFEYSPWITTGPEQGTLAFVVANEGNGPAVDFRFEARDRFSGAAEKDPVKLADVSIHMLEAAQDTTIRIPWSTPHTGLHLISTVLDPDTALLEMNRVNNTRRDSIYSIPKGIIDFADTVRVTITSYDSAEISVVPEVYFDKNSAVIDSSYFLPTEPIPGILYTIAERMKANPSISLGILGSICDLSGESDTNLALQRARAVRRRLEMMGVPAGRLTVVEDHDDLIIRDHRRSNEQDNIWHMQQNRKVAFALEQEDEYTIFRPNAVAVDTTMTNRIPFTLAVITPAGTESWVVHNRTGVELSEPGLARDDSLWGTFTWNGRDRNEKTVPINSWCPIVLDLRDSQGRTFMTRPDSMYIIEKQTIRRQEMFGAAKFGTTEPVYRFYWDKLMDMAEELADNPRMTLQFEGHACATGPEKLNERLSYNRAKAFTDAFLERIRQAYPDRFQEISSRVKPPVGCGESTPLTLKMQGRREVILGDNQSPVGRYLNRRIMVLLYQESE